MRYYYQYEKTIKVCIIFCIISLIIALTPVVINLYRPQAEYNPNDNQLSKFKIQVEQQQ